MKRLLLIPAVAALALTACGNDGDTSSVVTQPAAVAVPAVRKVEHKSPIVQAAEGCGVADNLSYEDTAVSFDTEGEEDYSGDSLDVIVCVLIDLEAPDSLYSLVDHTRALDGVQTSEWGDYKASWSYHPDDGLFLIVEVQS